jgi:hypothetical protein
LREISRSSRATRVLQLRDLGILVSQQHPQPLVRLPQPLVLRAQRGHITGRTGILGRIGHTAPHQSRPSVSNTTRQADWQSFREPHLPVNGTQPGILNLCTGLYVAHVGGDHQFVLVVPIGATPAEYALPVYCEFAAAEAAQNGLFWHRLSFAVIRLRQYSQAYGTSGQVAGPGEGTIGGPNRGYSTRLGEHADLGLIAR